MKVSTMEQFQGKVVLARFQDGRAFGFIRRVGGGTDCHFDLASTEGRILKWGDLVNYVVEEGKENLGRPHASRVWKRTSDETGNIT
jgi:cold shock CspA family protein